MDKETKKAIKDDLMRTTIPDQMKLMYMLANAVDMMREVLDGRIRAAYAVRGQDTTANPLLSGLNRYCGAIKQASRFFNDWVEPQIIGSTFFAGMDVDSDDDKADGNVSLYDQFLNDCGILVRLAMLFTDRCSGDEDALREVSGMLRRMRSHGVFKDEDIDRFRTRL